MAEFLALDWEADRICGVQADVSKSLVKIQKSFSGVIPEDAVGQPERVGAWLQTQLKEHGITAKQVVVSLPREEVIMRHLEVPPVSDDELPELVKFQSAAKSTIPLDQLSLDFLPLAEHIADVPRDVLVASVHRDRVRRIQTAAEHAGLELASIGISSISAAAMVILAEGHITHEAGDVSLIIARHGDRLEVSMIAGGYLQMTHSSQVLAEESEQSRSAILAEISRSMIALQKRIPNVRITHAWIVGSEVEESGLDAAINDRFQCSVRRLDPFRGPQVSLSCKPVDDPHGAFAGPIGQLLCQASEVLDSVDFINPRRPAEKKDYTNVKRGAIAAAVAAVVIAAFGYRMWAVADLEGKIAAAKDEVADQNEMIEQLTPQVEIADSVDAWASKRVDWLDEARQLADSMGGTERLYLAELTFGEGTRGERGTISATGSAKERFDVESLNAELMKRRGVELNPSDIKRRGRDGKYPQEFRLDVRLKEVPAETTTAAAQETQS
ncbi:MAG: type IV pilus biogenesis protein PilM [Planctomycetota bacterium]|jgi:Tfp pilus assembly PilM family ATPase